jgi:hypothetical protein
MSAISSEQGLASCDRNRVGGPVMNRLEGRAATDIGTFSKNVHIA